MKKENFFRWLQKCSSQILRVFFPEVVAYVNHLIEMRAKEKVSDDESVSLEETVPAKIKNFWSQTDTKCRAFWVLLAVVLILAVLMSVFWRARLSSALISAGVTLKLLFKAAQVTKATDER